MYKQFEEPTTLKNESDEFTTVADIEVSARHDADTACEYPGNESHDAEGNVLRCMQETNGNFWRKTGGNIYK